MSKNGSITYQVERAIKDKLAYGESKHEAKKHNSEDENIFSTGTTKAYLRECVRFAKFCKERYGCKTLSDCRPFQKRYLREVRKANGEEYKAASLSTMASAIAKLYGTHKVKTPERRRADITRSRGPVAMDRHYDSDSLENKRIEKFLDATGLRRNEAEHITGNQLVQIRSEYFIHVCGNQAKGGRERYAKVIGDVRFVVDMMNAAGTNKVFGKIHSALDVHSHRAKYAAEYYKSIARDYATCKATRFYDPSRGKLCKDSLYWCRGDLAGTWYDKKAMLTVSKSLGHGRIDVIAGHYLYLLTGENDHSKIA